MLVSGAWPLYSSVPNCFKYFTNFQTYERAILKIKSETLITFWLSCLAWSFFQPISYSSPRGGISQITEKGPTTASFLLVQQARVIDSGSYACHSSVGKIANVTVHVIRSKDIFYKIVFSGHVKILLQWSIYKMPFVCLSQGQTIPTHRGWGPTILTHKNARQIFFI